MELIEIAQLVTGIATLIVASVLIWQMIIQKRTLDIAHNDADANMSLVAMDTRSRTNEWFSDNCTPALLDKFENNKGLDSLTSKEFKVVQTYFRNTFRVLATEFRLGRLTDNNLQYYRGHFNWELDLSKRIFREYAKKYQLPFLNKSSKESMRYTGIVKVMNEILEEYSIESS